MAKHVKNSVGSRALAGTIVEESIKQNRKSSGKSELYELMIDAANHNREELCKVAKSKYGIENPNVLRALAEPIVELMNPPTSTDVAEYKKSGEIFLWGVGRTDKNGREVNNSNKIDT